MCSSRTTREKLASSTDNSFKTAVREVIYEKQCFIILSNTENRVENTTRGGVFLTKFEVLRNVMKHCVECLIYLLNRN